MTNNPLIHHRRSIRLKGYDYSSPGSYFITICNEDKERCIFGNINQSGMVLTAFGEIAQNQWRAIPKRFTNITIDELIIMPNHIHGILHVGAPLAGAHGPGTTVIPGATARVAPTGTGTVRTATVGDIIGAYKSLCVHECLQWIKSNDPQCILGTLWQRNYWEHIIRNELELDRIRRYIRNNPLQWSKDQFYGKETLSDGEIKAPIAISCEEEWMI